MKGKKHLGSYFAYPRFFVSATEVTLRRSAGFRLIVVAARGIKGAAFNHPFPLEKAIKGGLLMQLRDQVAKRLRNARIWGGLLEELEKEIERIEGKENRAAALFELGELCEEFFLRKDRAMAHYQQAFKQNPQQPRALTRARQIYREMGNLEMVATLLGLEMKVSGDADRKKEAERLLGETLLDAREREKARPHLEGASRNWPGDADIADALAATNYDREDWLSEAERLMGAARARQAGDPAMAARMWFRAARIFHIEAKTDPQFEECLRGVISLSPQHEMANFLLEKILAEQSRFDEIVALEEKRIDSLGDVQSKIDLSKRIGNMWLLRWKDKERAVRFYGRALTLTYRGTVDAGKAFPGHLAAFNVLREVHGAKGDWAPLLNYAELGGFAPMSDADRAALMLQAGRMVWREMNDAATAKGFFAEVARVFPENEELAAYVAEFGDPTVDAAAPVAEAAIRQIARETAAALKGNR